jgi:hypothetical protein
MELSQKPLIVQGIPRNTDTQLLDEFALFLVECQNGTECIQAGSILEYSENIKRFLSKLPFFFHMWDH